MIRFLDGEATSIQCAIFLARLPIQLSVRKKPVTLNDSRCVVLLAEIRQGNIVTRKKNILHIFSPDTDTNSFLGGNKKEDYNLSVGKI
jgi:hypothetical protein